MRIAVVVKQVPTFTEMALDADGRLIRAGLPLELNPYCRRAVSQAVDLAAARPGPPPAAVTVVTLGPPSAEDSLRESLAWGLDRGVETDGILITDPAFAGSDTLATARALAAALRLAGPFDLVLSGRNSVDADTGQVPPELAELLDLPFLTGVRTLHLAGSRLRARCEHDDGWVDAEVNLPAVLSCAERLIEPCKVDPAGRAAVPAGRIRRLAAGDLGPGPWGQAGSPTRVGAVRVHEVSREGIVLDGPLDDQIRRAVDVLVRRGALAGHGEGAGAGRRGVALPRPGNRAGPAVAVVLESDRPHVAQELLSAAAALAEAIDGHVVALVEATEADAARLGAWGADEVVALHVSPPTDPPAAEAAARPAGAGAADPLVAEDVAQAVADWAEQGPEPGRRSPWAVLAPSTAWGREVAGRAAARLGAGLTGDAVDLDVEDGRLVAWKPAFGGQVVAAITASSGVQMATVRPGMLPRREARPDRAATTRLGVIPRGRVRIHAQARDDDTNTLAEAAVVVGVGTGLTPDDYADLQGLLDVLGAELGATRKVTDEGWQPHARQIGITGRSIAPNLYVAIALSGKFNHMVGVRSAGTILAINDDPDMPVFAAADVGLVGDWRVAVPALVSELRSRL
jgi:electron transfer flavoprotein alpha subunit/electron transfer flavoprotein alpha/beta subunit